MHNVNVHSLIHSSVVIVCSSHKNNYLAIFWKHWNSGYTLVNFIIRKNTGCCED